MTSDSSSDSSAGTASSAVIFDVDGTLIDSTYHHAIAWHRAFLRHDLTLPLWRIHRTVGMGGDKLVAHVAGDDVEKRLGDELRSGWREEYAAVLDTVPPFEDAAALVRRARDAGHQVALASSGEPDFTHAAMKDLGLGEGEVDAVLTAQDVEGSKPDPDLLAVALERLGCRRAVMVGDTPYDVAAADRLGLACVTLLTGGFSRAELESAGAALVVESVAELLDLDWDDHLTTATEDAR